MHFGIVKESKSFILSTYPTMFFKANKTWGKLYLSIKYQIPPLIKAKFTMKLPCEKKLYFEKVKVKSPRVRRQPYLIKNYVISYVLSSYVS